MGRHLSPRYGHVILVSGCPVLIVVNWSQHWYAISFLLGSQASSSESKHWFSCGADGRSAVGGRCTVTWLPIFLGWVDLLRYGAPPTRAWSSAIRKTNCAIQWIVIYPVNSAIHLSNNWGQKFPFPTRHKKETFGRSWFSAHRNRWWFCQSMSAKNSCTDHQTHRLVTTVLLPLNYTL